ncbi:MAG: NAD(P)-dependent oxidoreductase [Verrucomicrobiales bacterium]|nr:NAD(P)-dependent oxidoreductase [Verrucomicrobiales bacterium]
MSNLKPNLSKEEARAAMAELKPAFSKQEALTEANRCLYCYDAPCIMACPTGIDIPGFIKKIATDNIKGSARTILTSNILGNSCARVCPTKVLCEGACVLEDREKDPIDIGRLQRYSTDAVLQSGEQVVEVSPVKSGRRVALIGAGPASLGCAAELVRRGHEAVIFEKKEQPGGLNTYGIAYYKMKPEVSLAEIEMIKKLGVEIRCGVEVGKEISVAELREEFDAVFLGIGLGDGRKLKIPGEDLPEVSDAIDFIEEIHTQPLEKVKVGKNVVVIGCGNTAIDAVSQAKRLGAENATILYRRSEKEMSAYRFEYALAKSERCEFLFNVSPVEIRETNGHVSSVTMVKTDHKAKPVEGSEITIECDQVIMALGQMKMQKMLAGWFPELKFGPAGNIETNPETQQTSVPSVYAGGDAANGGAEVVNAVAEGKRAALHLHSIFGGEEAQPPVQTTRYGMESPRGSGFTNPVRVVG